LLGDRKGTWLYKFLLEKHPEEYPGCKYLQWENQLVHFHLEKWLYTHTANKQQLFSSHQQVQYHKLDQKVLGEMQTLRAGCSKAEPIFAPLLTHSQGYRTAKV